MFSYFGAKILGRIFSLKNVILSTSLEFVFQFATTDNTNPPAGSVFIHFLRDAQNHGVQLIGTILFEMVKLINFIYIWSFQFFGLTILDLVLLRYFLSSFQEIATAIKKRRVYFAVLNDISK